MEVFLRSYESREIRQKQLAKNSKAENLSADFVVVLYYEQKYYTVYYKSKTFEAARQLEIYIMRENESLAQYLRKIIYN